MKFHMITIASVLFSAGYTSAENENQALGLRGNGHMVDQDGTDRMSSQRELKRGHQGNGGCKANCVGDKGVVCVNGHTYQNTCIATCQEGDGVEITDGPCQGDNSGSSLAKRSFLDFESDLGREVTTELMGRFSGEGFKYLGRMKMEKRKARTKPNRSEKKKDHEDDSTVDEKDPSELKRALRITADGDMYLADEFKPDMRNSEPGHNSETPTTDMAPPPHVEGDDGSERRRLTIVGDDTREKISSTSVYPYWRIGQVIKSNLWGSWGSCSGSIVDGTNKVLTNAHCVYDHDEGEWDVPTKFAPGRYRKCQTCWIWATCCDEEDPWGTWDVDYATILQRSIDYDYNEDDYAIMTMKSKSSLGHIGSHMGTLSLTAAPCTIDPNSRIVGYPGDKADGEMWSTGQCGTWEHECDGEYIKNDCDTTSGMSGAPMYDSSKRVFGMHAHSYTAKGGGPGFTQDVVDRLKSW